MRRTALLLVGLLASGLCSGQSVGDTVMTIGSASGGFTATSPVLLDIPDVDSSQGWSYGACVDPAALIVTDVADGATTEAFNGGDGPDFNQVNLFSEGWTVGVVISFIGAEQLAPGEDYEINLATFDFLDVIGSVEVCFCDTLGTPAVSTVVVYSGQSIAPIQECGTLTVLDDPLFEYVVHDVEVPGGPFSVNAAIGPVLSDGSESTQGFSMGLGCDPSVLTPIGLGSIGELLDLDPEFFGDNLLEDGWTVGIVYSFTGGVFIQFEAQTDVIQATYEVDIDPTPGETTELTWTNDLGEPAVANVVVVAGASIPVGFVDGLVTFSLEVEFIRGDCNGDGIVNVADAVWIFNELFLGGPASTCESACDANDDSLQDSSDAMYILNYRFLGGAAPAAPFPDCGTEPDVACDNYSGCP